MICDVKYINFMRKWLSRLTTLYQYRLNSVPIYNNIWSLAFPCFDCYKSTPERPMSGDLVLMGACSSLNHVAIYFHVKQRINLLGS
jgi:hypothetical protein